MKFNRLAALCRSMGAVTLYERDAAAGGVVQYIGVGGAIYKADGLPLMDADSILPVLDIPAKKRRDFPAEVKHCPYMLDFADSQRGEARLKLEPMQIVSADGLTLQPLSGDGVLWIDARYLAPIEDSEQLELARRVMPDGAPYVAVKDGLFLQALILPVRVGGQTIADLRRLADQSIGDRDADDNGAD